MNDNARREVRGAIAAPAHPPVPGSTITALTAPRRPVDSCTGQRHYVATLFPATSDPSSCFLCTFVTRDASSCTSVARRGCLPPFFARPPIPTFVSGSSSRCSRPSDDHVRCQGRRLSVRDYRFLDPPRAVLRNRRRNRQPLLRPTREGLQQRTGGNRGSKSRSRARGGIRRGMPGYGARRWTRVIAV